MFVLVLLGLVILGAVAQQPSVTIIPNPSVCQFNTTVNDQFPSPGFIILDISSTFSTIDTLSVEKNLEDVIQITSTVFSDSQTDIGSLLTTNSTHYSTLIYSLSYANGEDNTQTLDTACPKRVIVTVHVPDSVLYVCWNGRCLCNCAVKGAGVNIHFTSPQAGEMDMLSAAGFGYTRMDFKWEDIELIKGQYNYSAYDDLVGSLAPYNVTPYFILDYYNKYYDDYTSPKDTAGYIGFADFAVNSTMNYAGKGFIWELYNEPNLNFWRPNPNVTQYLNLGLEVGPRLKKATPHEIFVGPALADTGTNNGLDVSFLTTCFQGGMLEYWDAVSFHAYRQTNPETVIDQFRQVRQLISWYMPASKNFIGLLSGEWGYSTSWEGIDNSTQGDYIVREMLTNLGNEVPISIWYDWHDDGTDPTNQEHNFGTTFYPYYPDRTPCYDPKPAYISRKTMHSQLGGKRFNKRIWVSNEDVFIMLFNTAGHDDYVVAAWTTNASQNITIPSTSSATFQIVTMYGADSFAAKAENGYLAVTVTVEPIYITATSYNPLWSVIGATSRLASDYTAPYGEFSLSWTVPNPTSSNLSLSLNGSEHVTLAPGDIALFSQNIFVTRQVLYAPVLFTLSTSLGSFSFATALGSSEPLVVTPLPASLSDITVILDNPSGAAFEGYVNLLTSGAHGDVNQTSKLVMTAGQTSNEITFQVAKGSVTGYYTTDFTILDQENQALLVVKNAFQMMDDYSRFPEGSTPKGYTVVNDGDPKVPANFTLTAETPSGGPPDISSFALKFYMGTGWKFLWVSPQENNVISVLPVAMSCWIYISSTSALDFARVRVVDATGQTFQLTYGIMSWTGWHYATLQFSSASSYWGGANDGKFHLPLKLVASFLLDSSQVVNSGVVYFTPPVLIY